MEVQISPASSFNTNHKNMLHGSPGQSALHCEPSPKRFKPDIKFNCIVCTDAYSDPNVLYEHMKANHPELYERESGQDFEDDDDMDDDLGSSSDDYDDYSSILEPICELRQVDDEQDIAQKAAIEQAILNERALLNEHHLKLQLQLQLQLKNHLQNQLQLQNSLIQPVNNDVTIVQPSTPNSSTVLRPLSLRKLGFGVF